jgi:hypothetical protein
MKINIRIYRENNGWRVDSTKADDSAPYIGIWLAKPDRINYWIEQVGKDHDVTITEDERQVAG